MGNVLVTVTLAAIPIVRLGLRPPRNRTVRAALVCGSLLATRRSASVAAVVQVISPPRRPSSGSRRGGRTS